MGGVVMACVLVPGSSRERVNLHADDDGFLPRAAAGRGAEVCDPDTAHSS